MSHKNPESSPQTNPFWCHDGKDGNSQIIINMSDDPDDSSATVIRVSGRNAEKIADRLAILLNKEQFS